MAENGGVAERAAGDGPLVLGVDTCGPAGSVALARIHGGNAHILGQRELAGRTYSATLVAAVGEILREFGVKLRDLGAIVVVNGPGSFTGVRVGLSAVKGLAEPGRIPVVASSRLAVLAVKTGVASAALDAHRQEVFLRVVDADGTARELLAGAEELAELKQGASASDSSQVSKGGRPSDELRAGSGAPEVMNVPIAVCEDAAATLLERVWPEARLVRVGAPSAADAIALCAGRVLAADFADLAMLDGHYLRRSDAEIFGSVPSAAAETIGGVTVRRMMARDVDAVMGIAGETHHAPGWQRKAYEAAVSPNSEPRRVALVAEDRSSGCLAGFAVASVVAPEAELETIVTALAHRRRGVARELFSALKHELRRQGIREVMLEVRAGNRAAHGFYRFLGFVEEGRRPEYYSDPVDDAVLMRLQLR